MKNTRKLLAAVMALTMVSALAPMGAYAADGDLTTVDQNSTTKSGTMTATYDVSAKYTVTIPAGVTLESTNAVSKSIEASDVMLESGQKIKVTLNSADHTTSGATFHAQTDKGDSTATYTISKGETAVAVGDVVAEFPADGTQALTFSKAEGATYAGTHTETLTFGIAVEDAGLQIEAFDDIGNPTGEMISVPAKVGKAWKDCSTYIPNDDFWDALTLAGNHDTETYPANTLYWNDSDSCANGVAYYTGDALYIVNKYDEEDQSYEWVDPEEEISNTALYCIELFPLFPS